MKTNDPRTIVVYVQDAERFQAFWSQIVDHMATGEELHGAIVTGVGKGDDMTRLEEAEEELERRS